MTADEEEECKPVSSVQPGHAEGLEHNHNNEGQSGRIIIKHQHKVVPTALREGEAEQEAHHAAENCNVEKKTHSFRCSVRDSTRIAAVLQFDNTACA